MRCSGDSGILGLRFVLCLSRYITIEGAQRDMSSQDNPLTEHGGHLHPSGMIRDDRERAAQETRDAYEQGTERETENPMERKSNGRIRCDWKKRYRRRKMGPKSHAVEWGRGIRPNVAHINPVARGHASAKSCPKSSTGAPGLRRPHTSVMHIIAAGVRPNRNRGQAIRLITRRKETR